MRAQKQKTKSMTTTKIVGFRPPDEDFCRAFNLGMTATGADITELCIAAIRAGLPQAVSELISRRKTAEQQFLREVPTPCRAGK